MYINTKTKQYPITESEIRAVNSNTSYPHPFPVPDGYAVVFQTPQPSYDPVIQMAREISPILTSKNIWEQRWEVVSKFQEYTDEEGVLHTVAEQEAKAIEANTAAKMKALQDSIVNQTQQRLDNFAKTRNYDGILSLCTYATSTVVEFATEGQYGVEARDQTWAKLYEILDDVSSGVRPMPTSFSDIEQELPILEWPN